MRRPQDLAVNQRVLAWIESQLRDGFSGRFEIECYAGGVRSLKVGRTYDGKDISCLPLLDEDETLADKG